MISDSGAASTYMRTDTGKVVRSWDTNSPCPVLSASRSVAHLAINIINPISVSATALT